MSDKPPVDGAGSVGHPKGYAFVVTDEAGRVLFEIPLNEISDRRLAPRRP